ncbi:hypothetical protein EJB05_21771 [Eragrostis curvula]|uniref:Uncharacterized protein n=1 Tax=Eragrostis curvula TaxID=38414 RepID=A0A5J9V1S1_9POAL|nr:hypothetical protein EJB05_21771 [Eragrostis curvula]
MPMSMPMASILPALAACSVAHPISSSRRSENSPREPKKKKKHTPPPGDAYITIDDDGCSAKAAAVPLLTPQQTPGHVDGTDLAIYFLWGIVAIGVGIILVIFVYGFATYLCPPDVCKSS